MVKRHFCHNRSDLHVRAIAFNRRSGTIAVCQSKDNRLLVLDPSTGKELTSVVLPSPCTVIRPDPANDRLAVAVGGAVLLVKGSRATPLLHVETPWHLKFSSDGRLLAIVSNQYTLIEVIEVATREPRAKIPVRPDIVQDAWLKGVGAFSPNLSQLVLRGWTYNLSPQAVIVDACRKLRQGALDKDVTDLLGADAPTVSECLAAAKVR